MYANGVRWDWQRIAFTNWTHVTLGYCDNVIAIARKVVRHFWSLFQLCPMSICYTLKESIIIIIMSWQRSLNEINLTRNNNNNNNNSKTAIKIDTSPSRTPLSNISSIILYQTKSAKTGNSNRQQQQQQQRNTNNNNKGERISRRRTWQ